MHRDTASATTIPLNWRRQLPGARDPVPRGDLVLETFSPSAGTAQRPLRQRTTRGSVWCVRCALPDLSKDRIQRLECAEIVFPPSPTKVLIKDLRRTLSAERSPPIEAVDLRRFAQAVRPEAGCGRRGFPCESMKRIEAGEGG